MEFLTNWLDSSTVPLWSAFILGLMTAISPCPLATNITAIGFIGKDLGNRHKVFLNGLVYTAGRAVSYTGVAMLFFFGADQFKISSLLQQYGEKLIGPILLLIGIFMLDIWKGLLPGSLKFADRFADKFETKENKSYWDVLLLGVVFALAFCPYSGVLYFAILIPMTIASAKGLYLPIVFAIGTGIPVIIFAWLLAYMVSGVGKFYDRLKVFEKWFRRVIAVLFIGVGIYYIFKVYVI
jgi:cytochrome c biogenesis protein CcdA